MLAHRMRKLAKALGKRDKFVIGQRLAAKQQHEMVKPSLPDFAGRIRVKRAHVAADNFGAERCIDRLHATARSSARLSSG